MINLPTSHCNYSLSVEEFDMSRTSDNARKQQLLGSLAKNESPMSKFMWGELLYIYIPSYSH